MGRLKPGSATASVYAKVIPKCRTSSLMLKGDVKHIEFQIIPETK